MRERKTEIHKSRRGALNVLERKVFRTREAHCRVGVESTLKFLEARQVRGRSCVKNPQP